MRHPRLPATAVLVAAVIAAWAYAYTARAGADGSGDLAHLSLDAIEKRIVTGDAPPAVWMEYGRKLSAAGDHDRAALALARVIEAEPYNRPARFEYVMTLTRLNDAERLFVFLRDQVYVEPTLAVELLARPELRPFLSQERFATLQKEAKAQAMD